MGTLSDMEQAYLDANTGDDMPDCVTFPSYEDYVKMCSFWGITPLPLEEE